MLKLNSDRKEVKWLQQGFLEVNKLLFAYAVLRGLALYFKPASE
jgi:hypothetical protein